VRKPIESGAYARYVVPVNRSRGVNPRSLIELGGLWSPQTPPLARSESALAH